MCPPRIFSDHDLHMLWISVLRENKDPKLLEEFYHESKGVDTLVPYYIVKGLVDLVAKDQYTRIVSGIVPLLIYTLLTTPQNKTWLLPLQCTIF